MGKSSRAKRERRERDDGPVARLVGGFSARSLTALLEAGATSPTAAHCGPSIAALWHAVALHGRNSAQAASPADLAVLVTAVRAAVPRIATVEDAAPYDARAEVLVPWGSDLFRVVPGSLERPTALIRQHRYLAAVIDRVLIPKIGFGLGDVGELILRRIDQVATALEPHWPSGPAADADHDPEVSVAEMAAVADLPPLTDMVRQCGAPERARSALTRYTFSMRDLPFDLGAPDAVFGTALAVHNRGSVTALPAAFLIEALSAIGSELAEMAVSIDARCDSEFQRYVAARTARLLLGATPRVLGPLGVGAATPTIHSLVEFNDRQVLALDVAAGLVPMSIQHRLDRGAGVLEAIRPGTQLYKGDATWQVQPDARVARLQLIAGPQTMSFLGASGPTMRLEDLEWILRSSQASPIDLWYFINDLGGPERSFAWDTIDRWEVWRERKGFYLGGAPLSFMRFSPHSAVVEWEEAARMAPLERALHLLKLPPTDEWPIVAIGDRSGNEIADVAEDVIFQMIAAAVPIAVSKVDPSAPSEYRSILWNVAAGAAWKLQQIQDVFVGAARASRVASLRVLFQFVDHDSGPPLTRANYDEGVLTIGWDGRLESALRDDSGSVENCVGRVIAGILDDSERDEFVRAWQSAPPGIRTDAYSVVQSASALPEPLGDHEATRSRTLRRLGEHLVAEAVSPDTFEGPAATRFESRTVFPWLLDRFHESLADLDPDTLLPFALAQLERIHHQRYMQDLRFRWRRGFPSYEEDKDSDYREANSKAARVVALMVEEILAHPPTGQVEIDDLAWTEALSIAQLCIDSCFRSDAIHLRLRPTSIELTDSYEVRVRHDDGPTDIDMNAYGQHRAQATRPAGLPITTGSDDGGTDEQTPFTLASMPELADIDSTLRGSSVFGLDAIVSVLNVARQWDADPSSSASLTSVDELTMQCADLAVGASREECAAAIEWLTLRATDLAPQIPHWETERRAKRILTSPLVCTTEGLWVLPWLAESTLHIFLNYLEDGRLPWPDAALPTGVPTALDQYRQKRNRDLEKEVVKALDDASFVVRGGVKPEKGRHYGFTRLSGEIDALCFDPARSRVWVIEAKDLYTPYSYRQVRRLFDDFHLPGKYVDKLLKKVDEISAAASSIATKLDLPDPTRRWSTHGLIVTRHVEPGAFSQDARVPFCTLEDLVQAIDQDDAPEAGFYQQRLTL